MKLTCEIAKTRYSFKKAYGMVPLSKSRLVKLELMKALHIKHPGSWRNALNKGYVSPRLESYIAVNEIFKKYDIMDPWEILK